MNCNGNNKGGGLGTGECEFEISFQVPPSPAVGPLNLVDYSCHLQGVTASRTGIGVYAVTLITNCMIDTSKLPEFYAGIILLSGTVAPAIASANYATTYNANASEYFWTVAFTVYTNIGAAPTDVNADISVRLSWEVKKGC